MPRKFHTDILRTRYPEATILFIKTIAHRIYRYNKNALIITCGPSGSGKSYVDLELIRGVYAYVNGEWPSDEYVSERVFFQFHELLGKLNEPRFQDPTTSRGEMLIAEEVGTQASNRNHQNIVNKSFSFVVQTFRHKGMIIFFNVPSFTFIDSQLRKQMHYLLETKSIDKTAKMCICKPLELQYNSRNDKLYFHNITAQLPDNSISEVDLIGFPKIPDSLEQLYESKKTAFTNALNSRLQRQLIKHDEKENGKLEDDKLKPLTKQQQMIYEQLQKGLRQKDVAIELGLPSGHVNSVVAGIRNKGYNTDFSLENGKNNENKDIRLTEQLNLVQVT